MLSLLDSLTYGGFPVGKWALLPAVGAGLAMYLASFYAEFSTTLPTLVVASSIANRGGQPSMTTPTPPP